jgi:chromosome segregation ATPase
MTALDQLDAAIDRLHSAVEAHLDRHESERMRLSDELKSLKAHHSALQTEARTVSNRLDAAIGRLKSLVEA